MTTETVTNYVRVRMYASGGVYAISEYDQNEYGIDWCDVASNEDDADVFVEVRVPVVMTPPVATLAPVTGEPVTEDEAEEAAA